MASPTTAEPRDRTLEGVGWMLVTGFFFVCVTGIVRHIGSELPSVEAAFIRYALGLAIILPVFWKVLRPGGVRLRWRWHALRGFVHGIGVMLWFYAMARIPIAEVTAIGYIAPIFVTIGAAIFLGERLYLRRIVAVVAAFVGALVILRPGFQELEWGQLAQLGAAPLFACSFLLAKSFTDNTDSGVIVGTLSLFCMLTLLPGAIIQWRDPTWEEVGWLGLTAVFATLGHYTQTMAFRCAPITVTQPVGFLQLVWAMLLGLVAFGEPIDPYVILGGSIIVASATYISHREAVMARRQRTPTPQATKF